MSQAFAACDMCAICCVFAIRECVLLLWNVFSYYRMRSLTIECILLLQNAFSYYRMCSLTTRCVLVQRHTCGPCCATFTTLPNDARTRRTWYTCNTCSTCNRMRSLTMYAINRMRFLTMQCVLLVHSGMRSLATECVLSQQNASSYSRMCSLTCSRLGSLTVAIVECELSTM